MFGGKPVMGIALGRSGAEAALVLTGRRTHKVLGHALARSTTELLDPVDQGALTAVFLDLARQLPRLARRADVPLALCLPEPMLTEDLLGFADFPAKREEAADLVRARVIREAGDAEADPVCRFDVVHRGEGAVRVRVRSVSKRLRDGVEGAARRAGFHVTRLDGWAGYLSSVLDGQAKQAAFLWSDGQCWSLFCWDGEGAEFADTGWIESGGEPIARRVIRTTRAFARGCDGEIPLLASVPIAMRADLAEAGVEPRIFDLPALAAGLDGTAAQVAVWG